MKSLLRQLDHHLNLSALETLGTKDILPHRRSAKGLISNDSPNSEASYLVLTQVDHGSFLA